MSRFFLLIVFFIGFGAESVFSQINQGTKFVGLSSTLSLLGGDNNLMSLNLSSSTIKSDAEGFQEPPSDVSLNLNIAPKAGFFLVDNFLVGLDLGLGYSSQTDGSDDDKRTRSLLSLGPFFRFYVPQSVVMPFIEMNAAYGSLSTKYESNDDFYDYESSATMSIVGIGGGLAILLGENVSFDLLAGYNRISIKNDSEDTVYNTQTVVSSLGLKFGFSVLFF